MCSLDWNAAFAGAAIGAGSAAINGGNILKGALIGAFSGATFFKTEQYFKNASALNETYNNFSSVDAFKIKTHSFGGPSLTSCQIAGQIASHAVAGGVISVLGGGKFGHGFFSSGVTKGLEGKFLPGGRDLSAAQVVKGSVFSAMIGGTASAISGGKFANGARTAAFQYLCNQVNHAEIWENMKRTWNDYWSNSNPELSGVYAIDFGGTYVKGNVGVKGAFGVFYDTKNGDADFYKKVGFNFDPTNFEEMYGNERSLGFGVSYTDSIDKFPGDSTEYSVPAFGRLGLDVATGYGRGQT